MAHSVLPQVCDDFVSLQAKYHKAEGSNRSSVSENGDVKSSSHRQHGRRLSSQHSVSHNGSASSVRDHECNDSDSDFKPTNHDTKQHKKTSAKQETGRDSTHGVAIDSRLTVGKLRVSRHKSFDVQRSRMVSGPSSLDRGTSQDVETGAGAAENSGLLTVSAITPKSRSNQDLTGGGCSGGGYLQFSQRPSSSSRLSSRTDLRGFEPGPHQRRPTSAVSASNSVGSGLDDDDYIDPHRDVGIAVCIRDGYFSWLPRANSEALMTDVNFVADAGQYKTFFVDIVRVLDPTPFFFLFLAYESVTENMGSK